MLVILFFIGLIGNVIGTLAGGGGMLTLPTMMLLGMPVHAAIGANKVSNTVSTLSSFYSVFKRKEITLQEAWPILLFCFVGGLVGGSIASLFSGETLTIIAICLLLFALILSFIGKTEFGQVQVLKLRKRTAGMLVGVGIYDGMFGPGSGTLLLYLYASERLAYLKAVVLGRVGIFATCFGASIMFIASGQILWTETFALMIGSVIGSLIGIRLARKINAKHAKWLLRGITTVLLVQLVMDFISLT